MTDTLAEVIQDLADEQAALGSVLDRMPDSAWDLPTHAPGWLARDQVAHLAFFDEAAARAINDADAFRAEVARLQQEPAGAQEQRYLQKGRASTPRGVLDWWREASSALIAAARTVDAKARLPWYGPDMSGVSFVTARLMETWSHGLDVVDVVGIPRPDTDRLRHVAFLGYRTRPYSYVVNNREMPAEPVRVELASPSGQTWVFGEEDATNTIRGSATDFCRVVTQRRNIADTGLVVEGPAARDWMGIAQAFAGPPGAGRKPGEFPKEPAR
jgi:uncharacterized protein (TIGR03084 family)